MLTLAPFSVPAMIGLRNVWHWQILPVGASGRLWPTVDELRQPSGDQVVLERLENSAFRERHQGGLTDGHRYSASSSMPR
jgi:hypothetical protein